MPPAQRGLSESTSYGIDQAIHGLVIPRLVTIEEIALRPLRMWLESCHPGSQKPQWLHQDPSSRASDDVSLQQPSCGLPDSSSGIGGRFEGACTRDGTKVVEPDLELNPARDPLGTAQAGGYLLDELV
tara:strand:+ start:90 stop:473 length:384 start_codon:yes stop_codon:yes gene_type:complete